MKDELKNIAARQDEMKESQATIRYDLKRDITAGQEAMRDDVKKNIATGQEELIERQFNFTDETILR